MNEPFVIRRVTARVYRCPLDVPVETSFGIMRDRPMVLVELEDDDGFCGWGEVWCNFPAVGAEHRARLIDSVLAPLLIGQQIQNPTEAFDRLTAKTAVLALQSAEAGPFAQAIAGIDIALWDLAARRRNLPLYRFVNADAEARISVYASGLNPRSPEKLAKRRQAEGFTAFKLKIGFGADRDIANLAALRGTLGDSVRLMVDANQGWDAETALSMAPQLEAFRLDWLEEPLRADRPWSEWHALRRATRIQLAGGENIAGQEQFSDAIAAEVFGVIQPDIAKWGGFSGCIPVARAIRAAGVRYCPHYLGGGIGLLASAHLLAAIGGDGMLEIDANPNPLRSLLCGPLDDIRDGCATLSSAAGLGIVPDLAALAGFLVPH